MKKILLALAFVGFASFAASAQTVGAKATFGWDESAPDLTTVQAYTFKLYSDGATVGVALPATCAPTQGPNGPIPNAFTCTAPVPAFVPGQHTVAVTASNTQGESGPSAPPLVFTLVVVPNAPTGLRVQ